MDGTRKGLVGTSEERGSVAEVAGAFLKLGLTSFGGPIAHLGYFRDELVVRRRWLDEAGYADLVALCQFLPGPASSKVGFALGLMRGGPLGAIAAWTAFTLPSAVLMVAIAYGANAFSGPLGSAVAHGLKLVAVAIVAQAVLGMARSLLPDRATATVAVVAVGAVVFGGQWGQIAAIALGAVAGLLFQGRSATSAPLAPSPSFGVSRGFGVMCAASFFVLLFGLPLLRAVTDAQFVAMADSFYRSGALVFGGGHVVLPLLQAETVPLGWVGADAFLTGYGAAQAMPGPLFTFAAYLGAAMGPEPNGLVGAAIALIAIFIPGVLVLLAALPFWGAIRTRPHARAALRGANAAVVGVLASALYDPVWTSAVLSPRDFLVVAAGFVALVAWRAPPWTAVAGIVIATVTLTLLGA
ncbi:chromate transporter [Methylopila jiangsuensis]|uniref:Chromate transporter n=1 Tax=Methylopila jiangsuensis TaxID=586230 RepID=A0A9W6N586_9HYPH|nr:chromate efflux transporter [Methylopila jiangsuensis]MDR6284493.1 chromate transporter [Methylopila jiangsuensis]GLK78118.1 chromate transporter [Methylopila jiangsuensis]